MRPGRGQKSAAVVVSTTLFVFGKGLVRADGRSKSRVGLTAFRIAEFLWVGLLI